MTRSKILIDNDPNIEYEKNSRIKTTSDFFFIPILNSLPKSFQRFIKRSHKSVDEIIENKTTHKALEVLYKKGQTHHTKSLLSKLFHSVWFNTNNSKGVRNRLKLVKRELQILLTKFRDENRPIKFLSIASGSARAVVESLKEVTFPETIPVQFTFLDKNPEAIDYSKELLSSLNVSSSRWINDTVSNLFTNHIQEEKFDIVEMVGLMDYFNDERAIKVFTSIYKHLENDGALITANIAPNKEQKFITNVIGWTMIYRTAEDLCELLIKSGFTIERMKVLYEPLKVHSVIVAKK